MTTMFLEEDPAAADAAVGARADVEATLLGSLLIEPSLIADVRDELTGAEFSQRAHRLIFEAIVGLYDEERIVDVITVHDRLAKAGKAHDVGGLDYVLQLSQSVVVPKSLQPYIQLLREHAVLSRLAVFGRQTAQTALRPGGRSAQHLLYEAEVQLAALSKELLGLHAGLPSWDSLVSRVLEKVQRLSDDHGRGDGVPTGFVEIDRLTGGLQPSDLIILAARPAMGKTSLALNIAEHVALVERRPVGVFSMEMSAQQLVERVMSSRSGVSLSTIRRDGFRSESDLGAFVAALEMMRGAPIEIDDTPGMTVAQLRASARHMARKHGGLALVVVDYLQLMCAGSGRRKTDDTRAAELGEISRGLKMLAKELQCPVIALSQLNRSVEARSDHRPLMSDLRESGALEQDADLIWFIYRDEYYTKEQCQEPGMAEIIIAKHRNGPTGTVKLRFAAAHTRFENP